MCHRCAACGQATLLDLRVRRLLGVSLLVRHGWAALACRACGGTELIFDDLIVSRGLALAGSCLQDPLDACDVAPQVRQRPARWRWRR